MTSNYSVNNINESNCDVLIIKFVLITNEGLILGY